MTFSLIFSIWFPMRAANALLLSVRKAYGMGASHAVPPPSGQGVPLHHLPDPHDPALAGARDGGPQRAEPLRGLLPFQRHPDRRLHRAVVDAALRVPRLHRLSRARRALRPRTGDAKRSLRLAGVLFSLTAWMVLSLLFSLYVENAANYSVIYGSIGAIIVLLLWLYLSATMMIMGAEFNSVLMEMKTARG